MSALQEYLRYLVTLTAVLDPFLAVPIFLSVAARYDERKRLRLVNAVTVTVLAVPLLAGPGAIGTTIIAAQRGGFAHTAALIGCVLLVCVLLWSLLRLAHAVGARMGTTGLNIATRLLGLLLAAIAIQTMAEGLRILFPGLAD